MPFILYTILHVVIVKPTFFISPKGVLYGDQQVAISLFKQRTWPESFIDPNWGEEQLEWKEDKQYNVI